MKFLSTLKKKKKEEWNSNSHKKLYTYAIIISIYAYSPFFSLKHQFYKTMRMEFYHQAYTVCNYNVFDSNHTNKVSGSKVTSVNRNYI